ncbi:MAG: hypothetical protein V4548_13680 [Bacteroidota bacterium]
MESMVLLLTFIFCFAYLIQYYVYPTIIFSGAKDKDLFEDGLRIRLAGQGLSSLAYFYALTNLLKGEKKIINIILLLSSFSVIFLMGFRTMSLFIIFLTLITFIKFKGFNLKLLFYSIATIAVLSLVSQNKVVSDKLDSMSERQKTENLGNSDYIRITQFTYFTQNHFKNIGEYIIGSGVPVMGVESSAYGRKMQKLQREGINWVDWGLMSLSWIIGIPAVLVMIFYSFKIILLKLPLNYFYIKIWFVYLLVSSFTTMEFYRPGNFIVQAILIFIAEKVHKQYKNNKYTNPSLTKMIPLSK